MNIVTKAISNTQILFATQPQLSVGCIVPASIGVADGNRKVVKAGMPIKVDFANLQTPVAITTPNAVLLHDVDVTAGNANGTALIFGFVNANRVDTAVQARLVPGTKIGDVQIIKG